MKDLIEALTILSKYLDEPNAHTATHCEHDVLIVVGVGDDVDAADVKRLDELGFFWAPDAACWQSFRFGSA